MTGSIVLLGRGVIGFRGPPEEFRHTLWRVLKDAAEGQAHAFPVVQALTERDVRFAYLEPHTDPPEQEGQQILLKAAEWARSTGLWKRCVQRLLEGRPKPSVLDKPYPFNGKGRYGDVSPDALMVLYLKGDWLWPRTRDEVGRALDCYLAQPGKVRMPFGKFKGKRLEDLPLPAVVYLAERFEWQEPDSILALAVLEEYARRLVPYRSVEGDVVWDLPNRDWEPFDTRGFIPGEQLMGGRRKPSSWTCKRPPAQKAADEPDNLDLMKGRAERNKVYWATVQGVPVLKSKDDQGRVRAFDRALEAIDLLASADDQEQLRERYVRARVLLDSLALSEDWDPDDNPLLDELDSSFRRREEEFTPEPDWQPPRIEHVVRMMRGCRSEDDLLDVAAWVSRHKGLFTDGSLKRLRACFARTRAELSKQPEPAVLA